MKIHLKLDPMFSRIDIVSIIRAHIKTLRNLNQPVEDKSIYLPDLLTFFVFPLTITYFIYLANLDFKSQISNLIAIISIFGGFLFNLLAIIYSFIDKIKPNDLTPIKSLYAKELNANISFCIVLSIFIILLMLTYSLMPVEKFGIFLTYTYQFIEYLVVYLLIVFFLTLLMVISRIFILLQKESENLKR